MRGELRNPGDRTADMYSPQSVGYLRSDEDIAAHLAACLEEAPADPAYIAAALGTILKVLQALGLKLTVSPV